MGDSYALGKYSRQVRLIVNTVGNFHENYISRIGVKEYLSRERIMTKA